MALTNQQLAKKLSMSSMTTILSCPKCNYVTKSMELSNTQIPCPNCGIAGISRNIFPHLSSLKLLKMIGYFYVKACNRTEDKETELVNFLREKTGQTYTPRFVTDTIRKIQNFNQKNGKKQSADDEILKIIQDCLLLRSREEANEVFVPLYGYNDTFEEHKVIVMLTCTLLEKLFYDLLIIIYTNKGMSMTDIVKKLEYRNFQYRHNAFKEVTNTSLKKAIKQYTMLHRFYQDWECVRNARNDFVHKTPYAIGVSTAEKAFNLAKNAFSLFAQLQNNFCVLPSIHKVTHNNGIINQV